jgi:hypothetical protein
MVIVFDGVYIWYISRCGGGGERLNEMNVRGKV